MSEKRLGVTGASCSRPGSVLSHAGFRRGMRGGMRGEMRGRQRGITPCRIDALEQRRLLAAVVQTDQPDYPPGSTAILHTLNDSEKGKDFQVGETVRFWVHHTDGSGNSGDEHKLWFVTDGGAGDLDGVANGLITAAWQIDDSSGGSLFKVKAEGLSSHAVAFTSFTDSSTQPGDPSTADNTAPAVTAVYVRGATWSADYLALLAQNFGSSSAAYGYAIPAGAGSTQLETLPWRNIDQISIAFSEDVAISQEQFAIAGSVGSYSISGFSYSAADHVATWTLSATIAADRLYIALPGSGATPVADLAGNALDGEWKNPASYGQLEPSSTFPSGDGLAGGDFAFRFDVLPGDSTGGALGKVNVADVAQTSSRSSFPVDATNYRSDFDANFILNVADVAYASSRSAISELPADPPVLGTFSDTLL